MARIAHEHPDDWDEQVERIAERFDQERKEAGRRPTLNDRQVDAILRLLARRKDDR